MIPTPEEAWALLCQYNEGEFHRKHGRIVGDVLRWYAIELGYGDEADFWEAVGILEVAGAALHKGAGDPAAGGCRRKARPRRCQPRL